MNVNVKPLNNQVFIRPKDIESKSSSGLIIQGGDGDSRRGVVLAVADGVEKVKVDDDIFISWDKACPIRLGGEKYAFVNEEDIIAVIGNEQ
jgi:co-chaperonin GroES (HSP10)